MANPLLAGHVRARKRLTVANISPNQSDVKQEQAQELGPLHELLSYPPQPKRPNQNAAIKSLAKRLVIAAYCHRLLSAKTTQRLIDNFRLWVA
jgi:hypothetical protein